MKKIVFMITLFVHCALCNAQTGSDPRTVVGVSEFTCETDSKYAKLVTEKVVEMLTNAKRFRVVDRTSHDKIKAELELQKTEAFFDSKNLVEQDVAIAAEKMITGHINKIPVYSIKNTDGSVRGYKGSVSFQMKIVDVATGESTEATSFEGKASELMLSPESAVTQSMQSLQNDLFEYFKQNFPIKGKIVKIVEEKKDRANIVLLNIGTKHGVNKGDCFIVQCTEYIDGEAYPTDLGEIEVIKLSGDAFSECKVPSKIGRTIKSKFITNESITCKLKIK
ncbi:MAG: penicillin-binding protein activator LpoB [Bacteroidales bacterium]|nr:penicillin-binding protein activator LpoB [Bacteroidales bacterium]